MRNGEENEPAEMQLKQGFENVTTKAPGRVKEGALVNPSPFLPRDLLFSFLVLSYFFR